MVIKGAPPGNDEGYEAGVGGLAVLRLTMKLVRMTTVMTTAADDFRI